MIVSVRCTGFDGISGVAGFAEISENGKFYLYLVLRWQSTSSEMRTPGNRKKYVIREFDLADVQTMRPDCRLV